MEGRDAKAFLLLALVVLTVLACCCGFIGLNRSCEATGGHFEGYWAGRGMVCVGGK